ncbi:MAG: amino acid permease [Nitrososphaerales archaeon]
MDSERESAFSRNSTGLVREISPHHAFIYNFMAIGLCTFTWVTLFSIAYSSSFSGSSIGLAVILLAIAAVPFYLCTSMLSSAMPRAGGDYVWQSRILHPAIGFAAAFSAWTVWQWYFSGFLGVVITTLGFQPYFALLGRTSSSFASLSATLGQNFGYNTSVFEITTAIILLGLIVAALGIKFYVKLQYILFGGSLVSALTLLGVLASTTHAQFVSSFNSFSNQIIQSSGNQTLATSVQAAGGYYGYIIKTAGLSHAPFSLHGTLLLWGVIWLSFGYAFWSIYNLSEIKKAGNLGTQVWIQVGSSLSFAIFLIALWYLLERVVGVDFLTSYYTQFYSGGAAANPLAAFFTPYYPALIASISSSPIIWTLILVGLTFGLFQVILIVYFASTRIMLASSIDRVLPQKISYVSDRTHSPIVALLISAIGCEAFLYLIIYQSSLLSYFGTAGLATQIAYILICVTAILLPFRRKDVFENSPAGKYKVGRVPLLSILGVISLAVNLFIAWIFIFGPPLGTLSVSTLGSIEFVSGIFVACLLLYFVSWAVRKSGGVDLRLAFSEIPPE